METAIQPVSGHDRLIWLMAGLVWFGCLIWIATWTGPDQPSSLLSMVFVLAESGPLAMAWLAAAIGYGWLLRNALFAGAVEAGSLQIGAGVATLLFIDASLGSLGVLQWGGSVGAWAVLVIGWAGLIWQVSKLGVSRPRTALAWMTLAAAPSLAIMVLAACSTPGWLWASEFGGYDALSYHLQLPKQWVALGHITPLNHNVYSYLPGSMEAAYYHLAVLRGDSIAASYACQLLHASMAVLCAVVIARHAITKLGGAAGVIAGTMLLSTPWVIVTGSLAYNEMVVCLMLASGLVAAGNESLAPPLRGALVGLFAATACAAKLSAVGMVAAPLGVALLWNTPPRKWIVACSVGAIVGTTCLMPWLLRNWMACGNPVFPFATGLLGLGHWSAEQAAIWSHGHHSSLSLGGRLGELWNQFFRYGWAGNPNAKEPWEPLWSILQWLSLMGAVLLLCVKRTRDWGLLLLVVVAIQLAFWLGFTHLKSRFLLPVIVPLCFCLTGLTTPRFGVVISSIVALVLFSIVNLGIFHDERQGAPAFAVGQLNALTGDSLSAEQRVDVGKTSLPTVALNHLLPPESKVLLIGDARPFLYRCDVTYQTTWDRGPLTALMREFPDQSTRWADELRRQGFTYVLVDETMLDIWEKSGWNDPLLTRERVIDFVKNTMTAQYSYHNGVSIWRLNP